MAVFKCHRWSDAIAQKSQNREEEDEIAINESKGDQNKIKLIV